MYTIIRKRNVFHQLANLPTDHSAIARALSKRGKKLNHPPSESKEPETMEGATPAAEAEPGTLKVSLAATPRKSVAIIKALCRSLEQIYILITIKKKNIFFFLTDI